MNATSVCDDVSGHICCNVTEESQNSKCFSNILWAKTNMGGLAHRDWYAAYGVTNETDGSTVPNEAIQCMIWQNALKGDRKDAYPSPDHNCPRPCIDGDTISFQESNYTCALAEVELTPTEAPPSEEDKMPLWAITLISLVAVGVIIAGIIFYMSNGKSPQKKKKKTRGVASNSPPKKAPEPEQPAPVVATATPIYTTATPLTYTTAAPISASSFVYAPQHVVTAPQQVLTAAPQQFITTGVPAGSMYQQPVLAQGTPITTSQHVYNPAM